jgi:hypothetical protein
MPNPPTLLVAMIVPAPIVILPPLLLWPRVIGRASIGYRLATATLAVLSGLLAGWLLLVFTSRSW